mmetsp:Transcript_4228/g.7079  ORF Transcript_4228/g.7079 Transcript_4228/m.7079 type:complete len:98 (+) Transcript_4228:1454-1747(+)
MRAIISNHQIQVIISSAGQFNVLQLTRPHTASFKPRKDYERRHIDFVTQLSLNYEKQYRRLRVHLLNHHYYCFRHQKKNDLLHLSFAVALLLSLLVF